MNIESISKRLEAIRLSLMAANRELTAAIEEIGDTDPALREAAELGMALDAMDACARHIRITRQMLGLQAGN